MTALDDDNLDDDSLRAEQEREVAVSHALALAEMTLAREAFHVGRTFERAGIVFDPLTFVVLRVVEGSLDACVDPVECLNALVDNGLVERSVALAAGMLDEAA